MATARARMLDLSDLLSGNSARLHFLSITQTGGGSTIYGQIEVLMMSDLEVELESELETELEPELETELQPEIVVEVC